MLLKTLQKKLSNVIYRLLRIHSIIPSSNTHIVFKNKEINFITITIAFNNLDILRIQYEHLTKYLVNPFDHIIADNSNNLEKSKAIKLYCMENNISYVKIPCNILTGIRASGSHGLALNWCYQNIIRKYKPAYFGFVDHDLFPIKTVSVIEKMRSGFWGIVRDRKQPFWYFWPGCSFFDYSIYKNKSFDFSPYHAGPDGLIFLDTGGSNYYSICKNTDRATIGEASRFLVDITTKKQWVVGTSTQNTFEVIDSQWLHIRQISWRTESASKMDTCHEIISIAQEFCH